MLYKKHVTCPNRKRNYWINKATPEHSGLAPHFDGKKGQTKIQTLILGLSYEEEFKGGRLAIAKVHKLCLRQNGKVRWDKNHVIVPTVGVCVLLPYEVEHCVESIFSGVRYTGSIHSTQ